VNSVPLKKVVLRGSSKRIVIYQEHTYMLNLVLFSLCSSKEMYLKTNAMYLIELSKSFLRKRIDSISTQPHQKNTSSITVLSLGRVAKDPRKNRPILVEINGS